MTNDTLVYNVDAISELSNTLNGRLNEFNDAIDAMFRIIDTQMNQPDHWSGVTYDDLKDKCDNFRSTRIETMAANLKAYVDHFNKTSELSEETTSAVQGVVKQDALDNAGVIKGGMN